jgi:hypothetical protein
MFQNGACYKIVHDVQLWNLYLNLSHRIGAIAIVMPAYPLVYDGEPEEVAVTKLKQVADALWTLFWPSKDCCVQLHIESFNIDMGIALRLSSAIKQLPNLQSFFFEACRGSEKSMAVFFRSLRGNLTKLRHLYLPELRALETGTNQTLQPTYCLQSLLCGYPGCPDLVYLDVSYGKFGPKPFLNILDICRHNTSIEVLVLRRIDINHVFFREQIYRYISDGGMPLLDIVFGYDNEWKHFKNRMNHFFWLNKEDREREPMIQYLDCENPNSALLPYVLSPLLTKYKGPNDVYGHLRLMTNLKNHIIGHTSTRLPKRKRSQTIP